MERSIQISLILLLYAVISLNRHAYCHPRMSFSNDISNSSSYKDGWLTSVIHRIFITTLSGYNGNLSLKGKSR